MGQSCVDRYGAPYTTIHRVDLAQILQTACEDREDIELLHGLQVSDLTVHANGLTILCEGKNDLAEYVASAVIGAADALTSINDGDIIEINPATGEVTVTG